MTGKSGVLWACVLALTGLSHAEANWPQWRGPAHNGIAEASGLPETWSETENVVWKTALPSWSGGSPVIWSDRVFVTSASAPTGDGKEAEAGGPDLLLLCLSSKDGAILWQSRLDTGNELKMKQNNSSPSPVTDGTLVWAMTGTGEVVALTMDGKEVWRDNLQKRYGTFGLNFGYASSPILCDGKLIAQVVHGYTTDEPSYVMAFDAAKGDVLWRDERPTDAELESPDSYATPTVLRHEGETQIVVVGGDYATGHDAKTGAEVWRAGGLNPRKYNRGRIIASPVAMDGMVYVCTRMRPVLAFRAGGTGDITTSHLVWKWDRPYGPDVPTPACDGTYFYMFDDKGMATCLDAKTGEIVWGPEKSAQGIVSASPVIADGKIYITNEEGVTSVLAAGAEFRLIATNALPSQGRTLSSPAVAGNRLYLRTPTHLYCIGR